MKRTNARACVSQAGAMVHCGDEVVLLPWIELRHGPAFPGASARARAQHPGLPATIEFGPAVGFQTIEALRVRVAERALCGGSLDEYFLTPEPDNLARLAACVAVAGTVAAVAFEVLLRYAAAPLMPGVEVQFDARLTGAISAIRYLLVTCLTIVPTVLVLFEFWRRRHPRLLALHVTADGVTRQYNDGRRAYQTWRSIVQSGRSRTLRALLHAGRQPLCSSTPGLSGYDLQIIESAARRFYGGEERRPPLQQRLHANFRMAVLSWIVLVGFFAGLITLAVLFPERPKPGRTPPSPAALAVAASTLLVLLAALLVRASIADVGWHRVNLRWRQMWRNPRPERIRTASGAWPIP